MNEQRSKEAFKLAINHYWQQLLKDWKLSFSGLLLTGVGMIFVAYIPPLIIAKILQRYSESGIPDLSTLTPYILAFGGLWLFGELIWRLAIHMLITVETRGTRRLYNNAMQYLLDKDLVFFHDNFAGSLTTKTRNYAGRYIEVIDILLFNVTPYLIPLIFISFILWSFSPWLVVILIALVSLVIALIVPLLKQRRKLVTLRETASNKVSGHVADIYSNIDAVRSFANEDIERQRHRHNTLDLTNKMKRSWDFQNQRVDMLISPLYVLTNVIGILVALNVANSTGASIEVVFVTFAYYASFTRFLWEFNGIYRRLETAFSDAAQFTELLINKPKILDAKNPKSLYVTKGSVEFKNVVFDHNADADDALFSNLNLSIKPGEKIGLVGHSGGGKTTLSKLIMRLMDIDGGKITIDGQNIAEVKQADLRKQLSYVPQEPIMFHRTLWENIAYGKQDATQEEIEKAARAAHAHEFIKKLPYGYDTLVGERGVKLSGGQRQRIAVARAMLKNSQILLLDEATSALDSESEKLIQKALWKLIENKTAIVIAHRLSTIQKMDRIVVLDEGKIVEEGSHRELLDKKGVYSELWKHQSGGFLED
ncbi:MAG TPA: ABC transporter ATP-binding protein [Candidatus Saccharimonadales bacterium]|nr:ABC transporter ATP-binding protein [Candidatus Saccharimonadales bacterium]